MKIIDNQLNFLAKKWGYVELVYADWEEEEKRWLIRNCTDEGIGNESEKKLKFYGKSPSEAINNAIKSIEKHDKK